MQICKITIPSSISFAKFFSPHAIHIFSPMPLGLFPATGTPGCFCFGLVHAVGLPRYSWALVTLSGLTCCFDSGDTVEDGCAGQCRGYGTMRGVFFAAFSGYCAANVAGCPYAAADLHDYPSFCFCLLGCDCVFHDVVCLCVIDSTGLVLLWALWHLVFFDY